MRKSGPAADGEDDINRDNQLPKESSHQVFAAFMDTYVYLLCHFSDANEPYRLLKDLEIELTSNTCKQ